MTSQRPTFYPPAVFVFWFSGYRDRGHKSLVAVVIEKKMWWIDAWWTLGSAQFKVDKFTGNWLASAWDSSDGRCLASDDDADSQDSRLSLSNKIAVQQSRIDIR